METAYIKSKEGLRTSIDSSIPSKNGSEKARQTQIELSSLALAISIYAVFAGF
jgi:hypothetical protein